MTEKSSPSAQEQKPGSKTDKDVVLASEKKPQADKSKADKKNNSPSAKVEPKDAKPTTDKQDKVSKPVSTAQPEPSQQKQSKAGVYLGVTAIVIALGLTAGVYWNGHQNAIQQQQNIAALEQKLSAQQNSQQVLSQEFSGKIGNTNAKADSMATQLSQVKARDTQLSDDIKTIQRNMAEMTVRHPNDWMLAEAEYLVRMAGRKLWLEHDLNSSVALLMAADQRITELSDPSLSPLRRAIIDDITTLEALPKLDKDGLVLQISSLSRQVDKLNIAGVTLTENLSSQNNELSGNINDWKENLHKSWRTFADNFVTISRRDGQVEALLAPDQSWYLKENLKSQLLKAQLAVYREQQEVYLDSMSNAVEWLNAYYEQEDAATQHIKSKLQQLSKLKIQLSYPDQLKTQPILESVIEQRVRKTLASQGGAS